MLIGAGASLLPVTAMAQIAQPGTGQGAPSRMPPPVTRDTAPPARTDAQRTAPTPADPTAPIVPDPEFEAAVPAIGDDMAAPLPPIEAFDAPPPPQVAAPRATPTPPAGGVATPIDPTITEPLVPLASFDVTPVQIVGVEEERAVEIAYDVRVEGLDAIGLTSRFDALSALRAERRAPSASVIAARGREDEGLAVRLMQSVGYYDGTARSLIEPRPNEPGRVTAAVTAVPGPLYTLGTITIRADETVPAGLIRRELPIASGDAIDAERILAAEANVALRLPQQGYPFATVGQRDILLDEEAHTGAYTLPVDVGPRARFGGITTTGDAVFDVEHIDILRRYRDGALYDARDVDDLRQALVATGLFASVGVQPQRTGRVDADGIEAVDLLVTQNAGPPRSFGGEAGYGTGQGIRVIANWTHRNLFPQEGALIVTAVGGTQEQGAGVTFRRSNAGRRDRTVQLTASANRSNFDAFEAFTGTLAGRISYDSTPIWQKRWTYYYGAELIGTNEDVFDFGLNERVRRTYFIGAVPLFVGYDTSDSLLDPTRGFRLKLNLSPETAIQGGTRPYVRGIVEGTAYLPVSSSIVLAGRVRAGAIGGIARDALAPSRRFYAGGGGSVRGFGFQELGPRTVEPNPAFDPDDPDDDTPPTIFRPVGGRSFNEFAIEARYRFGNFGIVPFFDIGQVYESTLPTAANLRMGAGIGGRFYTNFGPLRVDVATPINRQPGESRIALYLSIGQAF